MEKVLLISFEPEKWKDFEESLSGSYKFITSKPDENANYSGVSIIAIDNIESMEKIPNLEKKRLPIIFFGDSGDFSTEIQARKLGVVDFFSNPVVKELVLFRFKNVSEKSNLIRWVQQVKREVTVEQERMAEIIAQTVESRDENTGGHIVRTAMFIGILGEEFVESGVLTESELKLIVCAAPLHDIGKIGIKDSILLKPGELTSPERLEMMNHSEKGAALIKKMQIKFPNHAYLQYAYDIALNHHERFDGKGYPNGIKGEEIPFCARLMSVVDVYDALTSDRVYRPGMPKEKAVEIIFNGNGTQFDPIILEAFDKCKDYLL